MGDGEEVSIGKTVQFSHGPMEASDSVASRQAVELWLTGLKLFHVEHWHLGGIGDSKLVGICGRTWSGAVTDDPHNVPRGTLNHRHLGQKRVAMRPSAYSPTSHA